MKQFKLNFQLKDLPNSLTLLRLILVIPMIFLLEANKIDYIFPFLIFGATTDYLDGYFAKKLKVESKFGAVLDPVSDKIFATIPLIWLSIKDIIPYWSISIIIYREFIVSAFRSTKKDGLPASKTAKLKTFFIFTSLILIFFPTKSGIVMNAGLISYWIGFIFTLTTSINYLRFK